MSKFVLSAYHATLSMNENVQRTAELANELDRMNLVYKVATSYYQEAGQDAPSCEVSFVVSAPAHYAPVLERLACVEYQQDCVLWVDNANQAKLGFNKGGVWESIGRWMRVAKEVADAEVCRTFMGGKWYIVA